MMLTGLVLAVVLAAQQPQLGQTFGSAVGVTLREVVQGTTTQFAAQFPDRRADLKLVKVRKIEVSPKFVPASTELIAVIPTSLSREQAEARVRTGFMMFLGHLAQFIHEQKPGETVELHEKFLQPYLAAAAKAARCGEVPCRMPPCCANCDPCPSKARGASGGDVDMSHRQPVR